MLEPKQKRKVALLARWRKCIFQFWAIFCSIFSSLRLRISLKQERTCTHTEVLF